MATATLLHHYVEYLCSPGILLTLMVVIVPILLGISLDRAADTRQPNRVAGCRRLGLRDRSNLDDQYTRSPPSEQAKPRIKALFTYPIKSCRGVELQASEVDASGLRYDRLFTFAQLVSKPAAKDSSPDGSTDDRNTQWRFITQREFPLLALVKTELWVPDIRGRSTTVATHMSNRDHDKSTVADGQLRPRSRTRGNTLVGQLEHGEPAGRSSARLADVDWATNGGCLIVRFPSSRFFGLWTETVTLRLPLVPIRRRAEAKRYAYEELSIWKDSTLAVNVTNEIDQEALAKLKHFLGVRNPLALFKVADKHKRAVTRCLPKDRPNEKFEIGFADAFPANLIGLPSVHATDNELPQEAFVKGKLDARRFRANIYIVGAPAFEEDKWTRITLGRRIGRDKDGLFETEGEYHVACRTARCKFPNVDPDTGVKDKNEPYNTLDKTRQVDKGAYPNPCLGMQMIPLFELGMVRVGDEVEVLETGEHFYEKMFP